MTEKNLITNPVQSSDLSREKMSEKTTGAAHLLNSGTAQYEINKSDTDDGGEKRGGNPGRAAALLRRNTLRGLLNGPWSGQTFLR